MPTDDGPTRRPALPTVLAVRGDGWLVAQFDAYRALGFHIGTAAAAEVRKGMAAPPAP